MALLAKASRLLFGPSLAGLRLLPALAGAATVWLAGTMARELGGGRYAQGLAALGVIVAPAFLEGFTLFTMNAFDVLAWSLLLWIAIRILKGGSPRLWLLLGVIAGLGLLNKHSVLFLLAGLLAGLVLTPARRHLRTRWPWLAAALALAIFAPHLAWQARHGWPTLEFMENARRLKNPPITPLAFLNAQAMNMLPLTAPVWIKPYYLGPFYPALFAAGAVAVDAQPRRRAWAWLRGAIPVTWLALAAIVAPVVLPVLPPERLERYLGALHLRAPLSERHRPPRLTQTYADQFGWEEMVAQVARVYHGLTPAERARCGIFASNYGEAGAIDFYGPGYGLPHAISGHNNYFLWGPGPGPIDVVITVGETPEDVEQSFRRVLRGRRPDPDRARPAASARGAVAEHQEVHLAKAALPLLARLG